MSIVALSPAAPDTPSPMVTSVTPIQDRDTSPNAATADHVTVDPFNPDHQAQDEAFSPGLGPSRDLGRDPSRRSKKPPPLHTGADWKVVLHLPEIEKWLRATSDRVTQLTHSVGQDSDNRHVDVHLVQLKDICEDISDHVEQIHALLETEFSLKLLSYSVNIIVDIRTVQLLWHQLRVSVLVLKERLLQGLQDSNGNYTRQTDILQAFSQDQHQTRLDALTEVDDCGQLTIRCSQDYFSLDCGITAFELSDYSPGEEPETQGEESSSQHPDQERDPDPDPEPEEGEGSSNTSPELTAPADSINHNLSPSLLPTMQSSTPNHSESAKRPLQRVSRSTEVSPTQPSLPKRAALFSDGGHGAEDSRSAVSRLQDQAELSRSSPSLMDPPDRSKFWLELDSVYPENVSQSYESLQVMNGRNLQRKHVSSRLGGRPQGRVLRPLTDLRSSSQARLTSDSPLPLREEMSQDEIPKEMEKTQKETHTHSEGDSDSSLPSPMREQFLSSDLEASGEESDPRPRPRKTAVWIVKRQGQKQEPQISPKDGPDREHWYGSEEFLALPAHLRKTEMLAMKLESLTQSIPLRPDSRDSTQEALQDVDDWDLTELNQDWDVGESSDDLPSHLPPLLPYRRNLVSRFSPTSSSDIAPSLDESIESGPLSDLQSEEDEGRRSADRQLQLTQGDVHGGSTLVHQLLQDIQNQDRDPDVWRKIECFVQQLDGFISWLQEALDSTENWTQPRQELDSLRVYLDTHLSFKLNVDSHSALKESIMEEGKSLLTVITSHQSALKEILHMVSSQWDQLQRQIRRQHGWMLRALRCIQARLLYTSQSYGPFSALGDPSANRQAPCPADALQAELISSQCEAQRAALEQMAIKLSTLQYPSPASRRHYSQLARNNSLQEFEAEYQELWDWLMDMDAMVTDSHQLMMSEEQRHHLFKSSHAELMMMENRKTSLLGRAESLKRSGTELPGDFHHKIHNLTHTWRQLEKILSEHSRPGSSEKNRTANMNSTLLVGGRGVAAENPRSALSPLTNSLLEQLEARIKELKAWLRDTELLIFNSCLRQDKDASEQLQSFKSLCSEVRARRRGVSSVLKLCQKLLQQSQSGPMAEVGPEAEQHREALQLLSINLERRWEAIVMQALQWQNRLKRELGEQQVPGNFLEPGLVDLHQISPAPVGQVASVPDDSWEWDETDMTITEQELQEEAEPDLTHNLPTEENLPLHKSLSNRNQPERVQSSPLASQGPEIESSSRGGVSSEVQSNVMPQTVPPHNNNNIYQVYSVHSVELYRQPLFPHSSSSLYKTKSGKRKQHILLKSLSKDSSFSSIESLPDLLGGLSDSRGGDRIIRYRDGENEREGGRGSGQSVSSRRSESESGIVSDTGDIETTSTNSEIPGEDEDQDDEEKKKKTVDRDIVGLHKDGVPRYNQRMKTRCSMKEKELRTDEIKSESRRNKEVEKKRRPRRGGGEAVEILINGRVILTPADSDSDFEVGPSVDSSKTLMSRSQITDLNADKFNHLESPPALIHRASSPELSQGSSLESLLALGVELFPSKDLLHRSASLESCLAQCHSNEGDTGGSLASLGELDLGQSRDVDAPEPDKERSSGSVQGEPSSGELSRRTLDLLKRLENIQSPIAGKMTRSVSDMTLRSSSPQQSRLPASPSLGGRHNPLSGISGSSRKGPPSLINESSATASLTELSSTEDSSLGSEDFAMLRNQHNLFLDPTVASNANSKCYRKRCHGNSQGAHGMEEADAASLSLVVNVSCTSACTDEDEDDSDLLSSSTLTLTEEELGVRDGEDEEEGRLSGASSGNEDEEDDDEEEMEGSYILGLEYMKRELQSWMRSPRTLSSSSKTEVGLWDELQCGTNPSSQNKEQQTYLSGSVAKLIESNTNTSGNNKVKRDLIEQEEEEENRRNATRSYISQFVDDVENGNVDQSCFRRKDEDDELLREESSVFTKKGESLREAYMFPKTAESAQDLGDLTEKPEPNSANVLSASPTSELLPFQSKRTSSLVGQLKGELPCHSSSLPSPPSLSPLEDCRSHDALHNSRQSTGGRKAITIQEKFKFSSFVTEETRQEVRDKKSSLPPKKRHSSLSSCCHQLPSPSSAHSCREEEGKKENVHDFVMKIIDMTSVALKSKENQREEQDQIDSCGSIADQEPASLAQIREKVIEHSHRPLHLRKGDFYSYLSLSSHDSDCGEVSQCSEDKSSTPVPYSIPAYITPTQGLHSPSPELFTSTNQHISSPASKRSPPGWLSKLKSPDCETHSAAEAEPTSPCPSLPPSPDIRDEETLFAACTEEVYLGPPLCYSMVLTKKPRRVFPELNPSLADLPSSQPHDSLHYLSQEGPDVQPGLSYSSPSKESESDSHQDHLYFQASSTDPEEPQSSFSSLLEPRFDSFSTSLPSNSISASLQGPGSKPEDDNPLSPPLVSSGAEREKRGEDPYLLCDVAGGEVAAAVSVSAPQEERSRNEGPPYLNPRARVAPIDSSAAECLADTKTLESNMGAVMTKISVCSSATNPSKEPAATATRINPKINCSAMREADREEGERRGEVDTRRVKPEEKGRRGRSGSQQDAKTAAQKQVSSQSSVPHVSRTPAGRSQASARTPATRTGNLRRLPVLGAGTSRIQL